MKKMFMRMVSLTLALIMLVSANCVPAYAAGPTVTYRSHCQNVGDTAWVSNGQMSGTQGQSLRMEVLYVKLSGISGGVRYKAHVEAEGWRDWAYNGAACAVPGLSRRMEAVRIELTGDAAKQYDILYRVHVEGIGTMQWCKNGETAGTTGQSRRIESIEIKLVKKSSPIDGSSLASPVPSGCKFSKKTNDKGTNGVTFYCYHDINRNVSTSTPVYAIADGVATYKQAFGSNGQLRSYGNFIDFKSDQGGYRAIYAHLSSFKNVSMKSTGTKTVTVATREVKKGEILGYIGTTGNSTGVHLHFELYKNGSRIDPTSVIGGLT